MNYPICFCYHPTKLVLIDDNKSFLNLVKAGLENNIAFETFKEPQEALKFFHENYHANTFTQKCYSQIEEDELDFRLDMRLVRNELQDRERFNEIAVVVVDYAMPEMNGIELSRQLKALNPLLKIVLLTGEADEYLAIQAFNEGLIDQYIRKPLNSNRQLLDCITQLQNKYFFDLTQVLMSQIKEIHGSELKWLQDPKIVDVFNSFLVEKNIVEYYILDLSCNFVLIDAEGLAYWFTLVDDKEMDRIFMEVKPTEYSEEERKEWEAYYKACPLSRTPLIPEEVVDAIRNKTKMPFFFTDDDSKKPRWEWGPYLHSTHKLKTDQNIYYYTFISHPSIYQWPLENFESYRDYLSQQNG